MKKSIIFTMIVMAFACAIPSMVQADSGSAFEYTNITATGTTAINFGRRTTEIYVVRVSTNDAYINWTSTTCAGSMTADEYMPASSGYVTRTNEVQTVKMSVYTATLPVNIQVGGKGW